MIELDRVSVTYVQNAAAAHVQAATTLAPGGPAAGRAFFVNDPEPVALWPWLNRLLAALGLPPVEQRVSLRAARAAGMLAEAVWTILPLGGEPPMTRFVATQLAASHWYDVAPARAAFGYDPPVPPQEAFEAGDMGHHFPRLRRALTRCANKGQRTGGGQRQARQTFLRRHP